MPTIAQPGGTTSRYRTLFLLTCTLMVPASPAWAATSSELPAIQWGAEVFSLIVAGVLLAYVFALAKVADGSAIAESINLVAAAIICLAASVLSGWAARFMVDGFSVGQAGLASQMLIIVALVLLTIYIARVRRSLLRFLEAATDAQQLLAEAQIETPGDMREPAGGVAEEA